MITVALAVQGMHCQSCVFLVEETLARDPAVHAVTVDLDTAGAEVTFDQKSTSIDAVCAAITDLGYPASLAG
jgi:copper chaperone CopZ